MVFSNHSMVPNNKQRQTSTSSIIRKTQSNGLITLLLAFLILGVQEALSFSTIPLLPSYQQSFLTSRIDMRSRTGFDYQRQKESSYHQSQLYATIAPPSNDSTSSSSLSSSMKKTRRSNNPTTFQGRMRGIISTDERYARKSHRALPPNVHKVATLEEFHSIMANGSLFRNGNNKVVAVRFYAPWCKACQAVQPFFYRIASQFPKVIFMDVSVTDKTIHQHDDDYSTIIPSLPYGHIYHPTAGLVEETRMTKKYIKEFARKVQWYTKGSCELQADGDASDPHCTQS